MPKFIVTVFKTEFYTTDIEIEAPTLAQAESMAEDDAQRLSLDWHYEESELTSYGEQIDEEA
jgi:nicotinate-nucleotide pyrophosphorylase